jgi:hypothetical protein
MYITPSLMSTADWDILTEAAKWFRAHASILSGTHRVGGSPDQLQIYGWAAWLANAGILTLRNPSNKPQQFAVDIQSA